MEFESIQYHFGRLPVTLVFAWVVWAFIIVLSIAAAKRLKLIPGTLQVIFEMGVEYVCGLADEFIGPQAYKFYPLFIGLFFFILLSNLIGFIPGLTSPTSDPNLTFGFAIMVFVYFVFTGFKYNGIRYLKQFLGPKLPWYMFPISILITLTEIISFFSRPFSLGLRLFANIFSKELFLGILAWLMMHFLLSAALSDKIFAVMPLVLRPVIMLIGLIIAFIQALVFMVLSMSYIGGAVHMEEH
jgi:F-type H+-transporting ATPase subunit a